MSLIRRVIFLFCLIYVKRADVSPILPTFHMTVSYLVAQKIRLKTYQTTQYWNKCAKNIMENVLLIFFCIRFLYSGLNFIISWPWPNLDGFFVCLLDRTSWLEENRGEKTSRILILGWILPAHTPRCCRFRLIKVRIVNVKARRCT